MDSVRFVLAIIMMVALIFVTNLLFPPTPAKRDTAKSATSAQRADSTRASAPAAAAATPTLSPAAPAAAATAPVPATSGQRATVESELYRYQISAQGAAITSAVLLNYKSFTRDGSVQLVANNAGPLIAFRLRIGRDSIVDLRRLPFQLEPQRLTVAGAPRTITARHADSSGLAVALTYTFSPDDYRIGVSGEVTGVDATHAELLIDMGPTLAVNEAQPVEDHRALAYVVNNTNTGITSERLESIKADQIEEGPLAWVAIKNKYFLALALSPSNAEPFGGLIAHKSSRPNSADLTTTLLVGRDQKFAFELYVGPQEYNRLVALQRDAEDVNPIGWRFFRPLIQPLAKGITWLLLQGHHLMGLSYGWVLILFGILVRIVLWPLNSKAMRSQLRNMELQPRVKEIQDRYKSDPQRMQTEMMKLYKEEGFNPLGGCLPMLIPFPVLITLYFVFQATIEFRGVPFLWLPDLSRADPLYILPVVMGVSMLALQWLSLRSTPNPNPQMKMMTWFMPMFMTMLFLNFASGLNLYYASSNIASIPQQLQIMRERKRWQAAKGPVTPAKQAPPAPGKQVQKRKR